MPPIHRRNLTAPGLLVVPPGTKRKYLKETGGVKPRAMVMITTVHNNNNSEGATMRLQDAREIAERVKDSLAPHCQRIDIAGNIRRGKPTAHYIALLSQHPRL